MTIRLGRGEDIYEALKLGSVSALVAAGSSGLENKVYVWHASGSDIEVFEPTDAGLIAALAAAASGDTVVLPSIPIALTAGITLGTYTELRGVSEYSILTASGFTGTAITMATHAVCHQFSLVFQATGTDAIGIDARFAGAVVDNVNVYVFNASSSNTAIYAGAVEA